MVLSVWKCFKWKWYRSICWWTVEVILRNARCNDEIRHLFYFCFFQRYKEHDREAETCNYSNCWKFPPTFFKTDIHAFHSVSWITAIDSSFKKNKKDKSIPLQARGAQRGSRKLRFPDYVTMAENGGKVDSLKHQPFLPPGNISGTHFCLRLSRPQGHSAIGRIMSMTRSGIETATFRFVAQRLNHCVTAVSFL